MAQDNHDTLVYRLAQILVKLNQGEKLNPKSLAEEFGVNVRTVQRDLNLRFAYLPLQKSNGYYHLDIAFLGKLNSKDIDRFASLAGVKGLFPSLSDDFLRDIFDARIQDAFLVKGHFYENLLGKEQLFRKIENAIISRHQITFEYIKADGKKSYAAVAPNKLINSKGIWYLAALDGEKLKTFSFTKIEHLHTLGISFKWDPHIDAQLEVEDGIWMSNDKQEVVLSVNKDIAGYFKRRQLIANQVIVEELEDGGLIVSAKGHINQILPIIRYWIPNIQIISPKFIQVELENELAKYLNQSA
jgi:predicted DNA-binding transcriptional regulator YafY